MARPDFDEIIDRTGTGCNKWDDMQAVYGVAPGDGIAMWVADMDFRPPASVQRAVEGMAAHGIYGQSNHFHIHSFESAGTRTHRQAT